MHNHSCSVNLELHVGCSLQSVHEVLKHKDCVEWGRVTAAGLSIWRDVKQTKKCAVLSTPDSTAMETIVITSLLVRLSLLFRAANKKLDNIMVAISHWS